MGTFVMVPQWFMQMRPNGSAYAVYCNLASHGMYDAGRGVYVNSRPSLATIARETGLSRATVADQIRMLCEIGVISRRRRVGTDGSYTSNVYEIHVGELHAPDPAEVAAAQDTPVSYEFDSVDHDPEGGGPETGPPQTGAQPDLFQGGSPASWTGVVQKPAHEQESLNKRTTQSATPDGEPTAATLLAKWIDYLAGRGIVLPQRLIAIYGREIKSCLRTKGVTPEMIGRALKYMLDHNLASKPASLASIIVTVQTGPPVREQWATQPARVPGRVVDPCPEHPSYDRQHCALCASIRTGVDPYGDR